jgi:hypothetical protein
MNAHPILLQRPTLNPYLSALGLIVNRFAWDLHPESFRSRWRLRKLRNQQQGRKAVILCNGPSLLRTDFSLLQASGAYTFGLNKINLLFGSNAFRPDSIVAVNPFVLEQNADFFNATTIPLFLDMVAHGHISARENVTFLHSASIHRFARDCSISVNQGFTVTFVAMEIAYHMGFAEVALVGCDHNFAQKGPANQVVVAGERDESHFDPNYFPAGVQWQLPDLAKSEMNYLLAKEAYEASGRRIVNCTVGGKLEIFERQGLADFLSSQ